MVIAQNAWRRLGVQVDTLELEWAVFINQRVDRGDFDAVVLGWAMDLNPDIYQLFHSSQTDHFQLNFVGYGTRGGRPHVRIRRVRRRQTRWPGAPPADRPTSPTLLPYVPGALADGRKVVRRCRGRTGSRYLPFR
jgi:ABC-type transport system substrate-binding protein